jgi:hypothetical protein
MAALAAVLLRPDRLVAARRSRARTRTVPPRSLRPLLASRAGRVRARAEALGDWLAGGAAPGASPLGALGDAGPDGADDLAELAPSAGGGLRRLLLRPLVLVTLSLALLALIAERQVLALRGGTLVGGRLLPVPAGARDLWASYAASWHATSVGSPADAHPLVAGLGVLSTVLLGKPWLAVDLLLLASVPLAGAVAYLAAGRITQHRVLRGWAAATWALLPAGTGAIAGGRLDAAAVQVALPALLVAAVRVLREDPAQAGWRRAWGLGLGIGLTAAFAPTLWPLAAVVLVAGALAALFAGSPRRAGAALVAAVVPGLLLLPWSWQALTRPDWFVQGPGRLFAVDAVPAWHLPLLQPGGPATPVVWATAGLLLAALGGLLRRSRQPLALGAWGLVFTGLVGAVVLSRRGAWPGVPLQLAGSGMLLAALVGANGVRTRLARSSFGWRQLTAAAVALAAAVVPVLAGATWLIRGADGPLDRGVQPVLPAFARAELATSPGLRVLVLRPQSTGPVGYALTGAAGDRLGATGTPPAPGQLRALDAVVADLLSPRGSDAAEALATRAVRYVALPARPGSDALAASLDMQSGLTRRASGDVLLWRIVAPTARLTVLPPVTAEAALRGDRGPTRELLRTAPAVPLPSGREGARVTLPAGPAGRLLVLAEASDPGWRATLDGRPLARRTAWGWAEGFVLPAQGGRLVLVHDGSGRRGALAAQALAVVLVLVLAAPAARRRRGLEVDDDDVEPETPRARELQGTSS